MATLGARVLGACRTERLRPQGAAARTSPTSLLRGIVWVPGGLRPGGMGAIGDDEPPASGSEDSEGIYDEH